MKGLIMYVPEAKTKKTTTVKEFPTDSQMKVTLTRWFPTWRAAECLICQGNFKQLVYWEVLGLLAKAKSSHNPPILPPPKETIYTIICIQLRPSALRDYRCVHIQQFFYVDL